MVLYTVRQRPYNYTEKTSTIKQTTLSEPLVTVGRKNSLLTGRNLRQNLV